MMNSAYIKSFLYASMAAGMLCLTACDDVKPDDRYIEGEPIAAERAVLLEDFTGQNCVNCPEAHEVIEQLEEQYGRDKVIAVSIHCGSFGRPVSSTNFERGRVYLMTDEGNAIMEAYGITSFPMGVVDMGSPITMDLWSTAVRNDLQQQVDVTIDLQTAYAPDETDTDSEWHGAIKASARIISGTTRNVNVQYWIVESGIVAEQRSLNGKIPEYVHNNVFRAQMFPGLKGTATTLADGIETVVEGEIQTRWNDKERWELRNLEVVAIVSDNTGVLQVTRKPVIPRDEDNADEGDGTETEE